MGNKNLTFKHICKEDTYMFNYTQLPDELFTVDIFKDLSLHAKVLYSFMLRRISLSKENSWFDEEGDVFIYYRADEIMDKFNCSNKTASKIMAELEEIGLIEKKRQGQGKPDIIYVNKFSALEEKAVGEGEEPELPIENLEYLSIERSEQNKEENINNPEVKKVHFQKCKNYTSRNVKNTHQEVKNLHTNYKDNNNNNLITSSTASTKDVEYVERVRLLEEEKIKQKIRYQEAERLYSAQIAEAVLTELLGRDQEYRDKFSAEMFMKICKTVRCSREPIVNLPGFINWCLANIRSVQSQSQKGYEKGNQFNQFMHTEYDFDTLENEILSN